MEATILGLNYALMLETLRSKGVPDEKILELLHTGKPEDFDSFGEGIPDWDTLISYYQANTSKIQNALQHGYSIAFLTKGALKCLLDLKFDIQVEKDYQDCGEILEGIHLSEANLTILRSVLSKNWEIEEASSGINLKLQK